MGRICLILLGALGAMCSAECQAQWHGRWYGWGGWGGYYSGEGSTPYSNAVRAEAEMLRAHGDASESYARAAAANEQARGQYLENQARLQEMRRQQRAASEERKAKQREEAMARAALRPPPKAQTELYPRLSADQLDPLTGDILWPDCLMDAEFVSDRKTIEEALRSQAEFGPDDRTSKIIFDTAHRMMSIRSPSVRGLDSQGHSAYRKFLESLAIEGDHAKGAMR